MGSLDDYELLDFGDGRKLERFGPHLLDRPAVQASIPPHLPAIWNTADARYLAWDLGGAGMWEGSLGQEQTWLVGSGGLTLELRLSAGGQVGIFPEQVENWSWIRERVREAGRQPHVLNLFAYTGGSTLAAAAAGAQVVHVDAARSAVQWARQNARHSDLDAAPIRWIVEDARRFVQRELRRGRRYDGLILDPPTFGRGPRGEVWQLARDLPALLEACRGLTRGGRQFMLLTCHTAGMTAGSLRRLVQPHLPDRGLTVKNLPLRSRDGRELWSGLALRWAAELTGDDADAHHESS